MLLLIRYTGSSHFFLALHGLKKANQYLQFVNFVCTAEPCLWQNRWFFFHQTLNGTVVHAAPTAFVHDSFQPQWSIRPWHISAYQHITFTASLWLCMISCLQRGSGLINKRIQPGKKTHPAYSSSQNMAVGCACVFYFSLSFFIQEIVQSKRKRGRYTLQDECTLEN